MEAMAPLDSPHVCGVLLAQLLVESLAYGMDTQLDGGSGNAHSHYKTKVKPPDFVRIQPKIAINQS